MCFFRWDYSFLCSIFCIVYFKFDPALVLKSSHSLKCSVVAKKFPFNAKLFLCDYAIYPEAIRLKYFNQSFSGPDIKYAGGGNLGNTCSKRTASCRV